jgi:hypothetical protein
MSLLDDFEAECMAQHAETNGHVLGADVWLERLHRIEGVYREMIRMPEWSKVDDSHADAFRMQVQYARNQLGLAERRGRGERTL